MRDIEYKQCHVSLEPGQALSIFTDGLTEAMNQDGQLYGTERVRQQVAAGVAEPQELVQRLIDEGNKVVVLTNDPYAEGAPAKAATVLCSFSLMGESMTEAAQVLYGKKEAAGKMPVNNFQEYTG